MAALRRRKLRRIWFVGTLMVTSTPHADGDKRAAVKALDDAFAKLDQLAGTGADPPASATSSEIWVSPRFRVQYPREEDWT
jgi:hypothetical protein